TVVSADGRRTRPDAVSLFGSAGVLGAAAMAELGADGCIVVLFERHRRGRAAGQCSGHCQPHNGGESYQGGFAEPLGRTPWHVVRPSDRRLVSNDRFQATVCRRRSHNASGWAVARMVFPAQTGGRAAGGAIGGVSDDFAAEGSNLRGHAAAVAAEHHYIFSVRIDVPAVLA